MFDFLPQNKRRIIESLDFWFFSEFWNARMTKEDFLMSLENFQEALIRQSFTQADINGIRNFVIYRVFHSIKEWREHWINLGTRYQLLDWYVNRELRIYKMPDVLEDITKFIVQGVRLMVNDAHLNFRVNYYGSHQTAIEQVRSAITVTNRIDSAKLSFIHRDEPYRNPSIGGSPHADIVIVNNYLYQDEINWGHTMFDFGSMIIAVPGERQKNFTHARIVAMHETAHLLGLSAPGHHDEFYVHGYKEVNDCLMLVRCTSHRICHRCLDAIKCFWIGMERRTGLKFFK